jgi:hypothetical protein
MKLVSSPFRINTAPAQKASAGAARLNMGSSPDREAVQVIGATPHRLEMCALLAFNAISFQQGPIEPFAHRQ